MKQMTNNEMETNALGAEFAEKLKPGDVVALYGDLGVGKTVFIKGVARGLGIEGRLLSPTFVLVRDYPMAGKKGRFYHFDLYRLEKPKDLKSVDLRELIEEGDNIIAVEWAEKAKSVLPKGAYKVKLKMVSESKREIIVSDK